MDLFTKMEVCYWRRNMSVQSWMGVRFLLERCHHKHVPARSFPKPQQLSALGCHCSQHHLPLSPSIRRHPVLPACPALINPPVSGYWSCSGMCPSLKPQQTPSPALPSLENAVGRSCVCILNISIPIRAPAAPEGPFLSRVYGCH